MSWAKISEKRSNPIKTHIRMKALKAAFLYTIPIFADFRFPGPAYGIYMNVSGFSFLYPMIMSITIFGGSHGIPELIAICVVIWLHLWKRQMLLSITGGTAVYMLLIHFIF